VLWLVLLPHPLPVSEVPLHGSEPRCKDRPLWPGMAAAPSPLGSPAASPPRPAGGPNLLRSAKQQWKSVGLLLNGAAVYLDDGAAEAVSASVGVAFLQSERAICSAICMGPLLQCCVADAFRLPQLAVKFTFFMAQQAAKACNNGCEERARFDVMPSARQALEQRLLGMPGNRPQTMPPSASCSRGHCPAKQSSSRRGCWRRRGSPALPSARCSTGAVSMRMPVRC